MVNSNDPNLHPTTPRFAALLAGIGKLMKRTATVLACQDVVLSAPFLRGDKWKMISGDSISYRTLTFDSAEAANAEFLAFGNLVTFGDAMFDFHLISAEEAEQADDRASYLDMLERHKEAAYLEKRRKAGRAHS
jgi:hypothetical protein